MAPGPCGLWEATGEPVRRGGTSREERIEAGVRLARVLAGTLAPFDEDETRRRAEQLDSRSINPNAAYNHGFALAASTDRTESLQEVTVPTLVIHGTDDPILPYEHGAATAKAIPGARLHTIEKMGHELPPAAFAEIADAILSHVTSQS